MILTIWALSASFEAAAQTKWNYSYDSTGNRIARIITSGVFTRAAGKAHQNLFSGHDITATLNENHNQLKIEYLKSTGFNITVYDLSGKELLSYKANSRIQFIDISTIRRGLYILKVESDEMTKTCKFRK